MHSVCELSIFSQSSGVMSLLLIWIHSEGENLLIQISWFHQKPADLNHHCFQKRVLNFESYTQCVYKVDYGSLKWCNFIIVRMKTC